MCCFRVCPGIPKFQSIDDVHFHQPAYAGDRVYFKAMVNRVFEKSIEIGVKVEAQRIGRGMHHINSVYCTFSTDGHKVRRLRYETSQEIDRYIIYTSFAAQNHS